MSTIATSGRVGAHLQQQLVGVAGLADDLEAGVLEQPRDALAQQHRVVGEHDAQLLLRLAPRRRPQRRVRVGEAGCERAGGSARARAGRAAGARRGRATRRSPPAARAPPARGAPVRRARPRRSARRGARRPRRSRRPRASARRCGCRSARAPDRRATRAACARAGSTRRRSPHRRPSSKAIENSSPRQSSSLASGARDRSAHERAVIGEHARRSASPSRCDELRRPFDVGEEERDAHCGRVSA